MRWFKLETYIGIEDDRDHNDMAEQVNQILMGHLVDQPYYLDSTTLTLVESPSDSLAAPWIWRQ